MARAMKSRRSLRGPIALLPQRGATDQPYPNEVTGPQQQGAVPVLHSQSGVIDLHRQGAVTGLHSQREVIGQHRQEVVIDPQPLAGATARFARPGRHLESRRHGNSVRAPKSRPLTGRAPSR